VREVLDSPRQEVLDRDRGAGGNTAVSVLVTNPVQDRDTHRDCERVDGGAQSEEVERNWNLSRR